MIAILCDASPPHPHTFTQMMRLARVFCQTSNVSTLKLILGITEKNGLLKTCMAFCTFTVTNIRVASKVIFGLERSSLQLPKETHLVNLQLLGFFF